MKQLHKVAVTVLAGAMLVLGLALAQEDDVREAEAAAERWMAAFSAGDAEAVADLNTDDAIFINAEGHYMEGRQALIAYLQAGFEQQPAEIVIEPSETEIHNDSGYQLGAFTVTSEEGEIVVQGYYLFILNRVDGEWKIHRHVANMILPEMPIPEEENDGM